VTALIIAILRVHVRVGALALAEHVIAVVQLRGLIHLVEVEHTLASTVGKRRTTARSAPLKLFKKKCVVSNNYDL
jgi:hypothetical protein